jgi:hypothetical protein
VYDGLVQVKGTAFLARKNQILKTRGEQPWNDFIRRLGEEIPFFTNLILQTTLIPYDSFLRFQERLIETFFDGKDDAYWTMGAAAAEWALTEGPYKAFIASKDVKAFVQTFPALWRNYFTTSDCEMFYAPGEVRVTARGLPCWHQYFEYLVMGYFKRSLEMLGAKSIKWQRLKGGPGVPDFCYRFTMTNG